MYYQPLQLWKQEMDLTRNRPKIDISSIQFINMEKSNSVYIGTSLDGYIGDKNGGIKFLDSIPIPDDMDMGYDGFMQNIDALVMGRKTFDSIGRLLPGRTTVIVTRQEDFEFEGALIANSMEEAIAVCSGDEESLGRSTRGHDTGRRRRG